MGQGTESCGGYDFDYDEYEDGPDGYWTQRDGRRIKISDMSLSHLRNTKRICEQLAHTSNCTSDQEKWEEWVEAFNDEIRRRPAEVKAVKVVKAPQPIRGTTVTMICHCTQEYEARQVDLDRGWARSCSKRCAAIRREFGRPAAKKKVQ